MSDYRLLTYEDRGKPTAGILIGDRVYATSSVLGKDRGGISTLGILEEWDTLRPLLEQAAENPPSKGTPLGDLRLLAPILYPPTVHYTGANYWDHVLEMAEANRDADGNVPTPEKPEDPWLNIKSSQSTVMS